MSALPTNLRVRELSREPTVVETPTDQFRRNLTIGILITAGAIFLILVGGGTYVLTTGKDEAVKIAQSILTTSIGVVSGVVGTIIGFFFQSRDK